MTARSRPAQEGLAQALGLDLAHPFQRHGLALRGGPFLAATVLAFAVEPLTSEPGQSATGGDEVGLFVAALTIAAAVVAAAVWVPWEALPRWAAALPPFAWIVAMVLLRDEAGGAASGYSILLLLPVVWFALYGTRVEVMAAVAAVLAALIGPVILIGDPEYPESEWRRAILTLAIASTVGAALFALMSRAREHFRARTRVEKMKDEFVGVVSHELRTPLGAIRSALDLLQLEGLDAARRERMLEIATSNAERLSRLIEDILDAERLEGGRIEFDFGPVPAKRLIASAVETVHALAEERGVTIAAAPAEGEVRADAPRATQVLINLLANALKFAPEGSTVDVGARREAAMLVFEVADRGPGIPDEMLASIFDRFVQVESGPGRARGGTGLGLSIAQAIVERHGGEIWAAHRPGGGTVFGFSLPVASG